MSTNRIKQGEKKNLKIKRKLRTKMTTAEKKLWLYLRGRQFKNLKFRRQHGIGPYIVDFYCPDEKLVIEVDGDIHAQDKQIKADQKRENYLKKLGLQIIRYSNNDILTNLSGVMENLFRNVHEHSTSPNPSLQRRGNNSSSTL